MHHASPAADPFERLSPYEKKLILTMTPSAWERHRMRNPRLSKQDRENLLLAILLERRRLYERCFKEECAKVGLEPPTIRNLLSEERLRKYQPSMNAALAATSTQRIANDQEHQDLRYAAESYQRDKMGLPPLTAEEDFERRQKRRKTRRMSP